MGFEYNRQVYPETWFDQREGHYSWSISSVEITWKSTFLSRSTTGLNLVFRRCPRGVMVKGLDSRIVVSEFKIQSHCYAHFQTNTLGKGINPLILPSMG